MDEDPKAVTIVTPALADTLSPTASQTQSGLGGGDTLQTPVVEGGTAPRTERPRGSDHRYTIVEELGVGGGGRVVAAHDPEIGRTVALKSIRSGAAANPAELGRFIQEARITGQLEHPSIIPVYDLGVQANGQPYYTMRIVKRRSLREVLAESGDDWPLIRRISVFVQVCRGVAYAHARGVLHRDLKPENILLGDFGEVYVADWGIAKIVGATEADTLPPQMDSGKVTTLVGAVVGTPGYMSPEQVRGEQGVDHRADLFSLGVILYEILTGVQPFADETTVASLMATVFKEPQRPRALVPGCPWSSTTCA